MRATYFRRFFQSAALATIIGVASAAAPNVVIAQDVGAATERQAERVANEFDDDDGMDWGWLGLLGLAGLLGLRRRDHDHDHTHRVDYPESTRRV